MKVFALICFLFCALEYCPCLADAQSRDADAARTSKHIFHFLFVNREGGGDGMKVERLRRIFVKFEDTLTKNIGKWKKKHGNDIPNLLNFVMKDDKHLTNDLKKMMKNVPKIHHENFVKKLNKFLGNLSKGKVESVYFFKNAVGVKVMKGSDGKKKNAIKYKMRSSVSIPLQNANSHIKRIKHMKKKLEKQVKKWTRPSIVLRGSKVKKDMAEYVPLNVYVSPGKTLLPVKSRVVIQCLTTRKTNVVTWWEKEKKMIPSYKPNGKTNGDVVVLPNGSLYIKSLRRRYTGIYRCVASSGAERQYATAVVRVAYLLQFTAIHPVKVVEGSAEANIKCVPPYGLPAPTVLWMKNGKSIQDHRFTTDTWTLVIKDVRRSDAGNYTCQATNVAKQRNVTATLEVVSKVAIENWVGKHFTKPHHLSGEEKVAEKKTDISDSSATSKSIPKDFEQNGIGNILLKGLLDERSEMSLENNDALSRMSNEQKKDYLEAERKWEMKLTQETQRLLDKLQPADAYIIPDLPLFAGSQSTNLEGLDAAIVIKKEFEEVAKRKIILGDDEEDLGVLKKQEKDREETSTIINPKMRKRKITKKTKGTLRGATFENRLADEEEEWLGVEKEAWAKIKTLEKHLNKLKQ